MPVCCVMVVVVVVVVGGVGGNLAGVLSLRTQDRFGVGGWGDATRNSMGLALSIFQDGSTGLPTRLGGHLSVTEPSNSVFPHPSTVHRAPMAGYTPKPVWRRPTPIRPASAGVHRTLSLSRKSQCVRTRGPLSSASGCTPGSRNEALYLRRGLEPGQTQVGTPIHVAGPPTEPKPTVPGFKS